MLANADADEKSAFIDLAFTAQEMLGFYRDQWYEAQKPPEVFDLEDAEIESDSNRRNGGLDS